MGLTFRFAELRDVPAIVALVESAYRGDAGRTGWTSEADLIDGQRTDEALVRSGVGTADSVILVAEAAGQLAGSCQLDRSPGQVYLGLFAVLPSAQGKGWGSQLIAEAERIARDEWAASTMVMTVIAQREDLIAWYARRGYRPTGATRPFPYGDDRVGTPRRPDLYFVVLAKSLGSD